MQAGSIILGLIIGGVVGAMDNSFMIGAVAGAVIGHLMSRVGQLESRLRDFEFQSRKSVHDDTRVPKVPETAEKPVETHPWFDTEPPEPVPTAGTGETAIPGARENEPTGQRRADKWASARHGLAYEPALHWLKNCNHC